MGCPLCYAAGIRGTSGLVLRAMPSGMWGRRRRALKIYHYRQKVQSHGGHVTKIEFLAGTYVGVSFVTRLTSINMTMHNMVRGNFLSIISIFLSKLGRKPYKFFFLASQKLPLTLTEFLKIHIEGVTTIWHRLQSLQHTVHDGYRWPSLLRHLGMEELHSEHASTGWTSCAITSKITTRRCSCSRSHMIWSSDGVACYLFVWCDELAHLILIGGVKTPKHVTFLGC
jgi:hypothetical protein